MFASQTSNETKHDYHYTIESATIKLKITPADIAAALELYDTHKGSRRRTIGDQADIKKLRKFYQQLFTLSETETSTASEDNTIEMQHLETKNDDSPDQQFEEKLLRSPHYKTQKDQALNHEQLFQLLLLLLNNQTKTGKASFESYTMLIKKFGEVYESCHHLHACSAFTLSNLTFLFTADAANRKKMAHFLAKITSILSDLTKSILQNKIEYMHFIIPGLCNDLDWLEKKLTFHQIDTLCRHPEGISSALLAMKQLDNLSLKNPEEVFTSIVRLPHHASALVHGVEKIYIYQKSYNLTDLTCDTNISALLKFPNVAEKIADLLASAPKYATRLATQLIRFDANYPYLSNFIDTVFLQPDFAEQYTDALLSLHAKEIHSQEDIDAILESADPCTLAGILIWLNDRCILTDANRDKACKSPNLYYDINNQRYAAIGTLHRKKTINALDAFKAEYQQIFDNFESARQAITSPMEDKHNNNFLLNFPLFERITQTIEAHPEYKKKLEKAFKLVKLIPLNFLHKNTLINFLLDNYPIAFDIMQALESLRGVFKISLTDEAGCLNINFILKHPKHARAIADLIRKPQHSDVREKIILALNSSFAEFYIQAITLNPNSAEHFAKKIKEFEANKEITEETVKTALGLLFYSKNDSGLTVFDNQPQVSQPLSTILPHKNSLT